MAFRLIGQVIICTTASLLSIGLLRKKFQWYQNKNKGICIQQNAFDNIICETAAILYRPQ